jgi:hypothetical protein
MTPWRGWWGWSWNGVGDKVGEPKQEAGYPQAERGVMEAEVLGCGEGEVAGVGMLDAAKGYIPTGKMSD